MLDWRRSTWGDEISLEYGKALRDYNVVDGTYRVFGSNGPIGWTSTPIVTGPGVILGRKGAYRGVRYSHAPFFVIDTAYYVVPKSDLDMRWLYYAIIHGKLGEIDDGSPIPSTTRSAVYVRDVDIPSRQEQEQIAAILGTLDEKIDANIQINETLEAMARAIFKDWFVDFGPTRAKAEGRTPYLAPAVWSLFPDVIDGHGIPDGWHRGTLLDICLLKRGYDLPNAERRSGPYQIVSSSGATGHHAAYMAEPPGVVTGRYGTIGEVFFLSEPFWPLNTTLYVRDFKSNSPYFVYYTLSNLDFTTYSDKGAVPGINRNHVHQAGVVVPPSPLQREFDGILTPLWRRREANITENKTLAQTRDLLLPKLMSGEIRVREAETLVEHAL